LPKEKIIVSVCVVFFWGGGGVQDIFPALGSVNSDPAEFALSFSILQLLRLSELMMLHIHRNDTVGQVNPEAVLKRWENPSCIHRLSTVI